MWVISLVLFWIIWFLLYVCIERAFGARFWLISCSADPTQSLALHFRAISPDLPILDIDRISQIAKSPGQRWSGTRNLLFWLCLSTWFLRRQRVAFILQSRGKRDNVLSRCANRVWILETTSQMENIAEILNAAGEISGETKKFVFRSKSWIESVRNPSIPALFIAGAISIVAFVGFGAWKLMRNCIFAFIVYSGRI